MGGSYNDPLKDDPRLGCVSLVKLKSYEYCLDSKTGSVFRPEANPFGTRWGYGAEFFAGRMPVSMAVSPDGGKLYVSLGTRRSGESVELGRIVSLQYGGRAGDTLNEDLVIYNLDVLPDMLQDRIAVGQNGLYFISRSGGRDSIWLIDAKTGALMNVLSGKEGETLSGLAVAPPLYRGRG